MRRRVFPILWSDLSRRKPHAATAAPPSTPTKNKCPAQEPTLPGSDSKRRRSKASSSSIKRRRLYIFFSTSLLGLSFLGVLWLDLFKRATSSQRQEGDQQHVRNLMGSPKGQAVKGPCAINLYGLPRKFADMVLPGLKQNVIEINASYECDYFVHYYDRREERDYRGVDRGRGGEINAEEVRLLESTVMDVHRRLKKRIPKVTFVKEKEEEFFASFGPFLDKIFNQRANDGRLLYIPISEGQPFPNTTTINIVKMWHSQDAVWKTMEASLQHYTRVAMLRSDVLFVSPVDIYRNPDGSLDYENRFAVIPNFSNFPVNDRMIYGPADAVRIWAAGRFVHLDRHVQSTVGDGIHSEKYLQKTIFPLIEDAGIPVLKASRDICFLRVRSDRSVRFQDCGRKCVNGHNLNVIQAILQRKCILNEKNPDVTILECNDVVQSQQQQQSDSSFGSGAVVWDDCPPKPI